MMTTCVGCVPLLGGSSTFETMDSGTTKTRIWTSSCQGSPGSMKADVPKIHALFANQIPGFAPMFDKTQ